MSKIIEILKQKWAEYLIEIIIIIIGIWGAFALNNWYEQRGLAKERLHYTSSLLENLKQDQENLKDETQWASSLVKDLDSLIAMLLQPEESTFIDFLPLVHSAKMTPKFNNNRITFDNLNNSGNLSKLNDNLLVEALFRYYNDIMQYDRGEDFAFLFTREQLIPILNHLNSRILREWLKEDEVILLKNIQKIADKQNLVFLAEKPELLNHLITKRWTLFTQQQSMNELIETLEILIDMVENNLN